MSDKPKTAEQRIDDLIEEGANKLSHLSSTSQKYLRAARSVALAKDSELAALRSELEEVKGERDILDKLAENRAKKLADSERMAEELAAKLRWAVPKLAHKAHCMICLPPEEWKERGSSWVPDNCTCGIAEAEELLARYRAEPSR